MTHERPLPEAAISPYPLQEPPAVARVETPSVTATDDEGPEAVDSTSLADRARDTFDRVKESKYGLPAAIGIGSAALLAALLYARRRTPAPPVQARARNQRRAKASA